MGLKGSLTVPGDKSISHRTLILGSLTQGVTRVGGLLESADVEATGACLRQLGVSIEKTTTSSGSTEVLVTGCSAYTEPGDILDAGNSGTTIRLLSGLLSPQPFCSILNGDESLRKRPMSRVIVPLRKMGARLHGRKQDTLAPLTILPPEKPLQGITYEMPQASAQVKSALLLSGLFADGSTTVIETEPTRDHSERMLRALGIPLTVEAQGTRRIITLTQGQTREHLKTTPGLDWQVPGDFSSAAFFIIGALLVPDSSIEIRNVNLNPLRTGLMPLLQQAGAKLRVENAREQCGEPVGDLIVETSQLRGNIDVTAEIAPSLIDEVPILAVAGLFLEGTLTIHGAEDLRKKESDRIAAMAEAFQRLGIEMEIFEDGFCLKGQPDFHRKNSGIKLENCSLSSHQDHRIAMSLTILNRIMGARDSKHWPANGVTVEGLQWVNISYPSFFEQLKQLETHS